MAEPKWLNYHFVQRLHDEVALPEVGPEDEPYGMVAGGLAKLKSALDRPMNYYRFEADDRPLSYYAAVYLVAIAKAHPFRQGNKRTALLTTRAFLKFNGEQIDLDFPSSDSVQRFVKEVAEHGVQEMGHEKSYLELSNVQTWVENVVLR